MRFFQQVESERNKRIALVVGLAVGGLWLAMTIYFLVDSKPSHAVGMTTVDIRPASPVAVGSTPSATYKAPRVAATPLVHHEAASASQWSFVQKSMSSSCTTMRLYQTSDATVKSIGGGGNTGGIATTNGHSNNGHGISYGGNMLALAASTPLASPGAGKANDIAQVTTETEVRAGRPRKLPGHEEEWWLTPVGDVTWPLMLLLTIGWCVRVRLKKQ